MKKPGPKSKSPCDERITIKLPSTLRKAVKEKAEAEERSEAWIMRKALEFYFAEIDASSTRDGAISRAAKKATFPVEPEGL